MSFIQCPLCGRNVLEASFNPESFEDDVFGVQMQGLGKGKGFRVR